MRKCDNCEYEFGEWCIHPKAKEMEAESRKENIADRFFADLWLYIDETPKWCPSIIEAEGEKRFCDSCDYKDEFAVNYPCKKCEHREEKEGEE